MMSMKINLLGPSQTQLVQGTFSLSKIFKNNASYNTKRTCFNMHVNYGHFLQPCWRVFLLPLTAVLIILEKEREGGGELL